MQQDTEQTSASLLNYTKNNQTKTTASELSPPPLHTVEYSQQHDHNGNSMCLKLTYCQNVWILVTGAGGITTNVGKNRIMSSFPGLGPDMLC